MKHKTRILTIVLAVMLTFSSTVFLSGCINKQATPLEFGTGVTMYAYNNGTDYIADFWIIVPAYRLTASYDTADNYLYNTFASRLETERSEDIKPDIFQLEGTSCYQFFYSCVIPQENWFFNSGPNVQNGFLTVTVDYDLPNLFSFFKKSGHPLNDIMQKFEYGDGYGNVFSGIFDISSTSEIKTTMLLSTKYTATANTGEIVYDSENRAHFYRLHTNFGDVTAENIDFSYTVMATYGYFVIALVLGSLTVLFILLFAKKKQGRAVDLTPKPAQNADIFGAYTQNPTAAKKIDPFGRDDDDDSNGKGGGSNSGGSGSGGVFDGF